MSKHKTGLVWFTNNLRVRDNESLFRAVRECDRVLAVYCFNPVQFSTTSFGFKKTDSFRAQFLLESVFDLRQNLKELNIGLFASTEHPKQSISFLCEKYEVTDLYFQQEWTQEEREDILAVGASLVSNIELHPSYEQFLFHPDDLPMAVEAIPKVFGNFRRSIEKKVPVRAESLPESMPQSNYVESRSEIPSLETLGLKSIEKHPYSAFPFEGGETLGMDRLHSYFFETKRLGVYKKTRNGLLGTDYSSKFSSWLANGSISAKTIYWQVKAYEAQHGSNQSTYWLVFELLWRDFFKYVSMKHGNDLFKQGGILQRAYNWESDKDLVHAWINGETPEPFVNANMIELKKTGWMSNRGRQNVASYFAKELQLDWRIGASYFESVLIDYDVHSNYGNWQYVAGVGNDPRDRKFNVRLQAERYDANFKFRNRWLQTSLFQ